MHGKLLGKHKIVNPHKISLKQISADLLRMKLLIMRAYDKNIINDLNVKRQIFRLNVVENIVSTYRSC